MSHKQTKIYKERGRKWELLNSWWVYLSLFSFGSLSFVSFLYIGFKTKNNLWKVFGFGYMVLVYMFGIVTDEALINLLVFIDFLSIVHVFIVRSKFLTALDALSSGKNKDSDRYENIRHQAEEKFNVSQNNTMASPPKSREVKLEEPTSEVKTTQPPLMKKIIEEQSPVMEQSLEEKHPPVVKSQLPGMIDMNQATEIEIASIPKMGTILAKKIIQKREELGGFTSFEEFVREVNLSENIAKSVQDRIIFSEVKNESKPLTGRMIDY